MEIKFNITGERRKQMVRALGRITGHEPIYRGAPTFAYAVEDFVIDKNGTLICSDQIDSDRVRQVIDDLSESGFEREPQDSFAIEVSRDGLTEAKTENLKHLVESKAGLVRKALAADSVDVEVTDDKVRFPWFGRIPSPEEISAYTRFITSLVTMAKSVKRVNARERDVDNEKYAFRCFLLRLGFIGDDYKTVRKILLSRLEGNTAFKTKPADMETGVIDE